MRKIALIGAMVSAGVAFATPTFAQSFAVDVPGAELRLGDRGYDRGRDYDGPRYHRNWDRGPRLGFYTGRSNCSDITIQKRTPSGALVTKQIHRCD